MNIKVIQYYTPNCVYGVISEKVNKYYCEKYNLEYYVEKDNDIIISGVDNRAIQWYKILFTRNELLKKEADYIIFMDADAVFYNTDIDIRDIIKQYQDKDLIINADFGPDAVNTGVMFFKNTDWSADFLLRVWEAGNKISRGKYRYDIWHEQTIMSAFAEISQIDIEKMIILNPSGLNSINDNILRPGITYIYHDLSKIRIEEIYKIQTGEYDVLTELNLSCTSDRHIVHKYGNYYIEKIEKLKTNDIIKVLDVGGDKGVVFDILLKYYSNLEYTNIIDTDYITSNNKINKIIYPTISEEILNIFLEKNTEEYDIVISDFQHQCKIRDLLFSKLFKKVKSGGVFVIEDLQTDKEISIPDKNAQYGWGDPLKKSMTQLIQQFQIDGTFNSDYCNFEDLYIDILQTDILETTPYSQLGLIYKK